MMQQSESSAERRQPIAWVVREFENERDATAVEKIDTSFSSEFSYEVERKSRGLELKLVRSREVRWKRFAIRPSSEPWQQAYVALKEDTIQGFIAMSVEAWNKRMVISHFYVEASCRRQGAGRALMAAALDWGERVGALTAWIETTHLNYPGIEAYAALGFEICGFDNALYSGTRSDDAFAVYMVKSIGKVPTSLTEERPRESTF